MRKKIYGLAVIGALVMSGQAMATGGNCNGRVDYDCTDKDGNNCTVYVQAARGCQIGF